MLIIAEVKTGSPFGWKSDKSWDELFDLASNEGDMISIHTDSRWNGSFDLVRRARALTTKPILAKGIHSKDEDIVKALAAGADYVLVVGRLPNSNLDKCLIEPNTLEELASIPKGVKAVWNSRDLEAGGLKNESFMDARSLFKGWLCQASNISNVNDVYPGADGVLVGTNLTSFVDSLR